MIKNGLFFMSGCLLTLITVGLVIVNYSDYRAEALISGWGYALQPHLEQASIEYERNGKIKLSLKKEQLHKADILYLGNNGSILLKGHYQSMLFIYPFINDKRLVWKCVTNTRIKQIRGYQCQ